MYCERISPASLSFLKSMIGRKLHTIYAPCLAVAGPHLAAPSFSIPLLDEIDGTWRHRFVNVSCQWFETPRFLNDYWRLIVTSDTKPEGIELNASNAMVGPCTMHFYGDVSPISTIDVYELQRLLDTPDDEAVLYDKVICFRCENGRSLCIACQLNGPGLATDVHFSEDEKTMSEFLDGTRLRLTINSR